MTRLHRVIAVALLAAVALVPPAAAQKRRRAVVPGPPPGQSVVVSDDFRLGDGGWLARFADYSPANDAGGLMELDAGIRPLPSEVAPSATGFMVTGHNRSDDLFMFLTKKLSQADGIRANQRYEVSYQLTFASNAGGEACAGIGGHPGFSVFVKAGASGEEPRVALDETDHFRVTVDKGNQSVGGPAASVAGNVSTGSDICSSTAPYKSLQIAHRHTTIVQSTAFGELWLIVGTDSGFEGKTTLYYQSIVATLRPVP